MYLKKNEIIDKIFYITIAVYFLFSAMTMTMMEDSDGVALIAKLIRYVCYVFLLFVIVCNIIDFNQRITLKSIVVDCLNYMREHLLLLLVLVDTVLILFSTGAKGPLVLVLLIWACSFYDFDIIIKVYFNVMFIFMLCTWLLSILGLVEEIVIMRGDRQRFSIGFIYPLETMTFYLFLVICYIYIKNKDFGIKDFLVINAIAIPLYISTDARTSYYLIIIVSAIAFIYAKTSIEKVLQKISPKLYCMIPFIGGGLSVLGGIFYNKDSTIWQKLNSALSGRLALTNDAFRTYGFSLFGQEIKWVGFGGVSDQSLVEKAYNFVDCGYAKMLLDYGIVFTILVLIGYAFVYKYAIDKHDYMLVIVLTVVLIVSVMEPRIISIEMNPFVLLLGVFFLQKNKSRFRCIKQ